MWVVSGAGGRPDSLNDFLAAGRYAARMEMGFEEKQSAYNAGTQSARAGTEKWVGRWL
jgi:hypothetical protein